MNQLLFAFLLRETWLSFLSVERRGAVLKEALKGLKVIDLCRSYPPAFAGMFLADFGADVIRIDTPGSVFPVPFEVSPDRFAAYYALDRNKRSLSVRLKSKEGMDIFFKLAESADVIIENSAL